MNSIQDYFVTVYTVTTEIVQIIENTVAGYAALYYFWNQLKSS